MPLLELKTISSYKSDHYFISGHIFPVPWGFCGFVCLFVSALVYGDAGVDPGVFPCLGY